MHPVSFFYSVSSLESNKASISLLPPLPYEMIIHHRVDPPPLVFCQNSLIWFTGVLLNPWVERQSGGKVLAVNGNCMASQLSSDWKSDFKSSVLTTTPSFLSMDPYYALSISSQLYRWAPASDCAGLASHGGIAILLVAEHLLLSTFQLEPDCE